MSRVAFVTGGARGIGAAVCRALAADGHAVAVADILEDVAAATAQSLVEIGHQAVATPVDVTDGNSMRAAVADVEAELGPIDITVTCAGWDQLVPFVETEEDFWEKVIDINYKGAMRAVHATLPGMLERRYGRIVTIASDAARVGSSLESVYAGAKGAVISFTKTIAREAARAGVTANVICPGPTETPLLDGIVDASADADKVIAAMTRAVPMKRLGQPHEVAAAVRFFASEDAGYITGQTLSVSGGLTMA